MKLEDILLIKRKDIMSGRLVKGFCHCKKSMFSNSLNPKTEGFVCDHSACKMHVAKICETFVVPFMSKVLTCFGFVCAKVDTCTLGK